MATLLIRLCFFFMISKRIATGEEVLKIDRFFIPMEVWPETWLDESNSDDEAFNWGSANGGQPSFHPKYQIPETHVYEENEYRTSSSGVDPRSKDLSSGVDPARSVSKDFLRANENITLSSGVDPRPFSEDFFRTNENLSLSSGVDPRSYSMDISINHPQRQNQEVCIVNVKRGEVIFVVDVGSNLPKSALPNVKYLIMSTLIVMELGESKIRVGVVSMGSDTSGVSEILPLSKGTSHRAVQEGLDGLVKGDQNFDYAKCLEEAHQMLDKSSNETVIVISVFTSPIVQTRIVDSVMEDMTATIRDLSFYHVTLSTTLIQVGGNNIASETEQGSARNDVQYVPEYQVISGRVSGVGNQITNRFGCDHCRPDPCALGTICILTEDWYYCSCPPGSVSGICEPCLKDPCNGSSCVLTGTGYFCDPCDPSPCQNEGKCYYGKDEAAFCECSDNFLGNFCELKCPDCPPGSICRNVNGTAVCECLEGFFGPNCSRTCDAMITCVNGGTCDFDENLTPICNCVDDFSGPRCENLCDISTCRNGGSCGVSNSERICYCTAQFEGQFCEIDKCATYFRCNNGGKCGANSETKQLECQCVPPFEGVDCSIGPCSNYSCFNDGICELNADLEPECTCIPPYFGSRCLDDLCSERPCLNGGTCLLEDNSFSCTCVAGYYGKTCMMHPCIPDPCFNGGTCMPVPPLFPTGEYMFQCLCSDSYTGKFCTVAITTTMALPPVPIVSTTTTAVSVPTTTTTASACNPNPCAAPCECKPSCKHSDGFVCVSKDGKLGKTCSIDAPSLDCGSHAVTISIDNAYLVEMLGQNHDHGYFKLGWDEADGSNVLCESVEMVTAQGEVHKLIVPAPFTACGTETSMNDEKVLTISNKVWFNVNSTSFDLLTPVFTWYCNYTTQYTATTSLVPEVDIAGGTLAVKSEKFSSVNLQLCKMTNTCAASCPKYLVVNPGAVYTVGQHINIIIQPVTVAGETLTMVDFYLSCGALPNSTAAIPMIDSGCTTGSLHSAMSTMDGSTCITFQLPRMNKCNIIYIHAKLGLCERTETCGGGGGADGQRCMMPGRERRSISHEDLFGPIYIFPLDETPKMSNKFNSQIMNDLEPGLVKETEDLKLVTEKVNYILVSILAVIALLLCCFLVFLCLYRHSRRYKLQA